MAVSQSLTLTQVSQNAAANTSQVRILWKSTQTGASYNGYTYTAYYYVSVNGGSEQAYSVSYTLPKNTTQTIVDVTITVPHRDNGAGSVAVRTWMDTRISAGEVTQAQSLTLATIPRASTLGATPTNIGEASLIAVHRKSAGYTHSIAYAFGSLSGYITADGGVSATAVQFSETTIPFTVPESFYAQIPDRASGVCTLTCRTYSGSTQIGQAQTAVFTVTANRDKCAPAVTGTVEDVNPATLALTGDPKRLVKFFSTARCVITAEPKNSASITEKRIGGVVVEGDSRDISNVETADIAFYAADSRGYTGTATDETLTLVPYVRLTGNASIQRTDPTSGNARLTVEGNYFSGSFGAADNILTVKYRVGFGDYVEVEAAIGEDGRYTVSTIVPGLDYTASHRVEIVVTDALDTVTKTLTVQKGIPVFDWGENDFRFNVPVSMMGNLGQLLATEIDDLLPGCYAITSGYPINTGVGMVYSGFLLVFDATGTGTSKLQLIFDVDDAKLYKRHIWFGTWVGWIRLI